MRKKIFKAVLGTAMIFGAAFIFNTQNVEARENDGDGDGLSKVIPTQCILVATGEVVGYSNDCGVGNSACTDRDCN